VAGFSAEDLFGGINFEDIFRGAASISTWAAACSTTSSIAGAMAPHAAPMWKST
jgi:hypothetical protein